MECIVGRWGTAACCPHPLVLCFVCCMFSLWTRFPPVLCAIFTEIRAGPPPAKLCAHLPRAIASKRCSRSSSAALGCGGSREIVLFRPRPAQGWLKSSGIRSKSPQIFSVWTEVGPISAKVGRIRTTSGREWSEFGPPAEIQPNLVEIEGNPAQVASLFVDPDRCWPDFGRMLPNPSEIWPNVVRIRPKAEIKPDLAELERKSAQIRPKLGRLGPNAA